jgi:hypothetical protein
VQSKQVSKPASTGALAPKKPTTSTRGAQTATTNKPTLDLQSKKAPTPVAVGAPSPMKPRPDPQIANATEEALDLQAKKVREQQEHRMKAREDQTNKIMHSICRGCGV